MNLITGITNYCFNWKKIDEKQIRHNVIKNIAFESIQEFAVGIAISSAICLFTATSFATGTIILSTATIVGLNTIIRCCAGNLSYQSKLLKHSFSRKDIKKSKELETSSFYTKSICALNYAFIDTNRDTFIHELGHATAAKLLFKTAAPSITIEPFAGGFTKFGIENEELTKIGSFLGQDRSLSIVFGAGAMASLIFSTGCIIAAHKLRDKHPQLSLYLLAISIQSIVSHAIYALSAFYYNVWGLMYGHDFCFLWAISKINPLIAAITILAIPIITKFSLMVFSYLKEEQGSDKTTNILALFILTGVTHSILKNFIQVIPYINDNINFDDANIDENYFKKIFLNRSFRNITSIAFPLILIAIPIICFGIYTIYKKFEKATLIDEKKELFEL